MGLPSLQLLDPKSLGSFLTPPFIFCPLWHSNICLSFLKNGLRIQAFLPPPKPPPWSISFHLDYCSNLLPGSLLPPSSHSLLTLQPQGACFYLGKMTPTPTSRLPITSNFSGTYGSPDSCPVLFVTFWRKEEIHGFLSIPSSALPLRICTSWYWPLG